MVEGVRPGQMTRCVQREEVKTCEGKSHSPLAWIAGGRETEHSKPIDKVRHGRMSESPGRSESERTGDLENISVPEAEPSLSGRRLQESAQVADATTLSGGAIATARRQGRIGEQGKSSPSRGEIRASQVGPITGTTGKWAEGGRMVDGSVVATNAGNAAGAKGPCWSVGPSAIREAGTK